ncbi:hypothetical protein [Mesorhizobium sp. B2-3-4]|uniref:hypothetical protein n=1 Tax=Mesorhizobium sp. B2-3-4 TaxID=2589959 RepID=UPI00112BC8FE|nr:hypothetical protein [Mesorhizobium sp. B2-3-4]TPM38124.1 hypothetical protein FJ967_12685 [Mesorhizobium sp. B2-3-4]
MANAAADGAGLHDAMYGQVDPRTGQVVKTGLFDTLFDDFVKQAPAELRPGLASRKPALREAGSIRMALQQNQRRRDYEQAEVDTALRPAPSPSAMPIPTIARPSKRPGRRASTSGWGSIPASGSRWRRSGLAPPPRRASRR